MRTRPFLALALLTLALPAGAQNFLTNPGFGTSLTGWSSGGEYAQWSPLDANGSDASGSAQLTNTVFGEVSLRQCVTLTAARTYRFSAKTKIASGQATTGRANLRVLVYATAGCTGSYLFYGDSGYVTGGAAWSGLYGTVDVPANAQSVSLLLVVRKFEEGGSFQAWFDDVSLGPVVLATLTVPAAASIHGSRGTFFHSDLWVMNRSSTNAQTLAARFRCYAGQTCASQTKSFVLQPRQAILHSDVVGEFFASPESAGAIELTYDTALGQVTAGTRVYTPSLPAPTNGASIPALAASDARIRALFIGLGTNGGDLGSGFRTNVGAYNPNTSGVSVTFSLYNGATGAALGSPLTQSWAANEARQVNDVFTAAGAGATVTTNAYLVVTSSAPVFPYVTVIDNQSGDSVFVPASSDEAP